MARWLALLLMCVGLLSHSTQTFAQDSAGKPESDALHDEHDEKESDEKSKDAKEDKADADKQESKEADEEKKADSEEKASDKEKKDEAKSSEKAESKKEDEDKKDSDEKAEKEKKKPEAHTVETKDLKIEVTLDGVFVSSEMETVVLRPETWSSFKVVKAVEHGKRVRKGETLVEFDDEKYDQSLADKSLQQQLGQLAMMEAEEELPRYEKAIELSFDQAERSYKQQIFEFERYKKTMRPMTEKIVENNLKSAQQSLDNAREELVQLQKMYEADELTEETEEIVLRRQKHAVEMAEFYMEYSQLNHDYSLEVTIPRYEEQMTAAMEESELAFAQAKMEKRIGLSKKRFEMERLREAHARSVEEHAKLVADGALFELEAPVDGVVYYGDCVNGRWTSINSLQSKLEPFGTVTPNSVVFTIVQSRPLFVMTSVGEKDFPTVKDGQKAKITPVADSELEFPGKVKSIANAPSGSNKFELELDVDLDDAPEWLVPGLTCKAKLVTYEAEDAVVIPQDLVNTDEDNPKKKYVMLQEDEDEEPVRRDVELGKKKGKEVEILKGLEEGDKIVKEEKKDEDEKE